MQGSSWTEEPSNVPYKEAMCEWETLSPLHKHVRDELDEWMERNKNWPRWYKVLYLLKTNLARIDIWSF